MNMPTLRPIKFHRKFDLKNHLFQVEVEMKSFDLIIGRGNLISFHLQNLWSRFVCFKYGFNMTEYKSY